MQLYLNGQKEETVALIDTGASCTLIRSDVAERILGNRKRHLRRCDVRLKSVTGESLYVLGKVEFTSQIGPIEFVVVKDLPHEVILGYDQLCRHGFVLGPDVLQLGGISLKVIDMHTQGSLYCSSVSPNCVGQVVAEFRHLFGAGALPSANLPEMTIETQPGAVVCQRPYRTALSKRAVVEAEVRKMLELSGLPTLSGARRLLWFRKRMVRQDFVVTIERSMILQ